MKSINIIGLFVICMFLLAGCQKNEEVASVDSWEAFLGDSNGKTDDIIAAPEVDDNGNPVSKKSVAKRPDTEPSEEIKLPTIDIAKNLSAKEYLEKWLESFKHSDWVEVGLLSNNLNRHIEEEEEKGAASYVYSKIKWKIKDEVEKEDKITFLVEISVPDITKSLENYLESEEFSVDNDKLEDKIKDDIKELVKKSEISKKEIEITLYNVDSIWKVEITDELMNTMTGGLSDFYRQMLQNYFDEVGLK